MAKYVLLYSGGSMADNQAERDAIMAAWGAWFDGLGAALVDGGNPFASAAKRIASDGKVSDGAEGKAASGYSIIQADSLDAAVQLAKGCPVLQGGAQITVYEIAPAM